MAVFICLTETAFANGQNVERVGEIKEKIGVVIVDGEQFKNKSYYRLASEIPNCEGKSFMVDCGDEIQAKYSQFCNSKGISDQNIPKVENLTEFVEKYDYKFVVYITIPKADRMEWTNKGERYGYGRPYAKVTMQVDGYLCDRSNLVSIYSTIKEHTSADDIGRDYRVRASTGAFKSCCREISKAFNGEM